MNLNSITKLEDLTDGQVLLMNKPIFWTSFDLVNKVRSQIAFKFRVERGERRKIKVGHAGTLDPFADGLMIICTGKKTKTLESFQGLGKEYVFSLEFGKTTPSFDLETPFDQEFPEKEISLQEIEEALRTFEGSISQVPPIYSAKTVKGKRAYHAARNGEQIELEPQQITIDYLHVLDYNYQILTLEVGCSKGTYIRSLARDIGKKLQTGAHIVGLCRTQIGEYRLEEAVSVSEFEQKIKKL